MLKSVNDLMKHQISTEDDIQSWDESIQSKAKCVDGVLAVLDLGKAVEVYIHPTASSVIDEEGNEKTVYEAYCIRCQKPITYGKLINTAEKQEYDEENLGEISAINRKGRQNPEDEDVVVHDNFIQYVKEGLHSIGYGANTQVNPSCVYLQYLGS